MENEKLKNCPLCNQKKTHLLEKFYPDEGVCLGYFTRYSSIECDSCEMIIEAEREEKAIEKWNNLPRKERKWIKCSDRLPDINKEVLILVEGSDIAIGRYAGADHKKRPIWFNVNAWDVIVTHWMPLPEPPEE